MAKRGDNIRKRKDGRWEGRYKKGRAADGSIIYGSVYGKTYTMMKRLQSRADEMAPTMRFLVTVCASSQYKDKMKPALDRLTKRYGHYAEQVAKRLNCNKEDVEPYVYLVITAVANYMIFSEDSLVTPQIRIAKEAIHNLLSSSRSSEKGGELQHEV